VGAEETIVLRVRDGRAVALVSVTVDRAVQTIATDLAGAVEGPADALAQVTGAQRTTVGLLRGMDETPADAGAFRAGDP
jgi:hypothetical protein